MADALDSGSSGSNTVWVQVPSSAGNPHHQMRIFFVVRIFFSAVYVVYVVFLLLAVYYSQNEDVYRH